MRKRETVSKKRNETTAQARKRALKAWVTIRQNQKKLSLAGKKAWATRKKNEKVKA
jgi:hypothetical protein